MLVEGNVFADAGMHGLQARGRTIRNNLFVRNPIGMNFGMASGATAVAGGVSGEVSGNIFLGGRDVGGEPRLGHRARQHRPAATPSSATTSSPTT